VAEKPARLVSPREAVLLAAAAGRFVGRGGEKLEAALERLEIDVSGRLALDAGASTGGFTDCLLQRGAARVVAVDVGRAQLHWRLRADPRVICLERTDIRSASAFAGGGFGIVVADLSFISLRAVAGTLVSMAEPGGDLVVLVKPQFEVGRREASRAKGVIRDPELWQQALSGAQEAFRQAGGGLAAVVPSSLRGADGNVEFFLHLVAGGRSAPCALGLVQRAVREARETVGSGHSRLRRPYPP
jgi:23S rRNA (cytidine1920-2'-O)/16S rRNA (cytidine1409-2'-O)-methyltransferase